MLGLISMCCLLPNCMYGVSLSNSSYLQSQGIPIYKSGDSEELYCRLTSTSLIYWMGMRNSSGISLSNSLSPRREGVLMLVSSKLPCFLRLGEGLVCGVLAWVLRLPEGASQSCRQFLMILKGVCMRGVESGRDSIKLYLALHIFSKANVPSTGTPAPPSPTIEPTTPLRLRFYINFWTSSNIWGVGSVRTGRTTHIALDQVPTGFYFVWLRTSQPFRNCALGCPDTWLDCSCQEGSGCLAGLSYQLFTLSRSHIRFPILSSFQAFSLGVENGCGVVLVIRQHIFPRILEVGLFRVVPPWPWALRQFDERGSELLSK